MSKVILISGSNSFIARNIIKSNIFKNFKFILATTNYEKCWDNYSDLKSKDIDIEVIEYNELNKKINPEIFIHLAISYENGATYNLNFTKNLITSINLSNTKIIFISSGAVYGDYEVFKKKNESYPLNGEDNYAKIKILSERLFIDFCNISSSSVFIIRCFPLIGDGLEKKFFLSNFQDVNQQEIRFISDLNNYRSFADIKYLLQLALKISLSKKKIDIVNFGSSKHYRLIKFANYISKKKQIKFFIGSKKDSNYKRYYLCDNNKLKIEYGINPDLNFEQISKFFL